MATHPSDQNEVCSTSWLPLCTVLICQVLIDYTQQCCCAGLLISTAQPSVGSCRGVRCVSHCPCWDLRETHSSCRCRGTDALLDWIYVQNVTLEKELDLSVVAETHWCLSPAGWAELPSSWDRDPKEALGDLWEAPVPCPLGVRGCSL